MGWLSDTWDSAKDAVSSGWDSVTDEVSSAWDSTQDAIRDVTGVDSLNTLFATGGLAMVPANLAGKGFLGESLYDAIGPLTGAMAPPQGPPGGGLTGPLTGGAPAGLTMGSGGQAPPQTVGGPGSVAGLFGESGYSYGGGPASTALLQANPEAYQYRPLMGGVA